MATRRPGVRCPCGWLPALLSSSNWRGRYATATPGHHLKASRPGPPPEPVSGPVIAPVWPPAAGAVPPAGAPAGGGAAAPATAPEHCTSTDEATSPAVTITGTPLPPVPAAS